MEALKWLLEGREMAIKLLLIDDDTDFIDVTSYALRRAGFELTPALTGREQ